jgi:hypothetical protein
MNTRVTLLVLEALYLVGSYSHTPLSGYAISVFYRKAFIDTKIPVLCSDKTASQSCMVGVTPLSLL